MTRRAPWQAMNQDAKIVLQSLRPHRRIVKETLRRERIAAHAAAVPKVEHAHSWRRHADGHREAAVTRIERMREVAFAAKEYRDAVRASYIMARPTDQVWVECMERKRLAGVKLDVAFFNLRDGDLNIMSPHQ
jgi:hypothetical protein